MSAPSRSVLEDRLALLRKSYGAALHERIESLLQAASGLHLDDERRVRGSLQETRVLAHKLAGSGATFGYPRVGRVAQALESCLDDIIAGHALPGEHDRREVARLLQELRQTASEERLSRIEPEEAGNEASVSTPAQSYRLQLVQRQDTLAPEFLYAFRRCSFDVRVSEDVVSPDLHVNEFRPDILIVELGLQDVAGLELAERLWRGGAHRDVEVFFLVKSEEFIKEILASGISDEWLIYPPLDSEALARRVLRRMFNIRVGREPNNRTYLMPCLGTIKALALCDGNPADRALLARPAVLASSPPIAPSAAEPENFGVMQARPRVLVVDDDRHLVEAISEVLSEMGIKVMKAHTGYQAVQLAMKHAPDLIITDFEMPNGSAEYLLSQLRTSTAAKSVKTIVMTGERVLQKYQLGSDPSSRLKVDSYHEKPLDLHRLCVEVKRLLAQAELERASRKAEVARTLGNI